MIEYVIHNELRDGQKLMAAPADDAVSLARKIEAIDFARVVNGQPKINRLPLMLALARLTTPTAGYGLEALAMRLHAARDGKTFADCAERAECYYELGRYSRVWRGSDDESDHWHQRKYGVGVLDTTAADKCWLAAARTQLVECATYAAETAGQVPVVAILRASIEAVSVYEETAQRWTSEGVAKEERCARPKKTY